MAKNSQVIKREEVVIRFSGDSGDGMQLTGTLFSDTAALFGNDLSTFPDYPAEIRAPQGTVGGVSGFQVHVGHSEINTPGDYADVLVAMNPAAVKANARWVKPGGTIIFDKDNFTDKNIEATRVIRLQRKNSRALMSLMLPSPQWLRRPLKISDSILNQFSGPRICLHWEWFTGFLTGS
jgi:Pyruvate/2-oxoacid:ferredoxin oxidoreductase gamma subunit